LGYIIQHVIILFLVLLVAKNYEFVEGNLAVLSYFSMNNK